MDVDYECFNKGEELFTKVTIYIYTDSNKNMASFQSVRCLSNFNQTSFSSLFLSLCPLIKGGKVGPSYPTADEAVPDVAVSLEATSWHVEWQIMVP